MDNPLQKWGLAVAARRGRNKAAVAVARKLAVAVWHVLSGHVIGALEPLARLQAKLFKLATEIGVSALKAAGHASKAAFIEKNSTNSKTILDQTNHMSGARSQAVAVSAKE